MPENPERKKFLFSLILPLLFIFLIWVIKLVDYTDDLSLYRFGNQPRSLIGLPGIIFSPFIHSDFNHLISNTFPLLILGTGIIYFYRELAYKVIFWIWMSGGILVWLAARDSYHIGASGLIYGIASFLFFSGIFRRDTRLTAISLLVVFLYGSLVWGIFPFTPEISWEYHLLSAISGFVLAQIYRKQGPQQKQPDFENDDDSVSDAMNEKEEDVNESKTI